ncbi:hypothetical protein ILUMI_21431 [Ignelater luminosus]|uniref:Uncharacterized protein n=1 Tax=Ignelater luminosus TaxID=2038154 RepID=A0A8K0CGG6_IGNLU|nr:hypothetical protein ILUMI_21431 [Ignelater luminosus]
MLNYRCHTQIETSPTEEYMPPTSETKGESAVSMYQPSMDIMVILGLPSGLLESEQLSLKTELLVALLGLLDQSDSQTVSVVTGDIYIVEELIRRVGNVPAPACRFIEGYGKQKKNDNGEGLTVFCAVYDLVIPKTFSPTKEFTKLL